ncbi:MAG TPA: hypothetical protein VMA98_11905 [Candidatus Acidoferrales bacterium]|nr:hypothetical protein [Candidatus Acidoferrales bacterium]
MTLGTLIAGCGGGGRSGVLPGAPNALPTASNVPASKTAHATIALYVPPANKQNARAKPFYISSNTQSFAILAVPAGTAISPPPPLPSGIQIFPVATPSPCAAASGGGDTCTFTVTAPVGSDIFYVGAFATASPGISSIPISAFISGPVTVSLSPAPSASPLSFTLNGIVYKVAIAVASPDPNNTPNTQVFQALVSTTAPLAVTAYDASNNVVMSAASAPFYSPIVINASPASAGVTLTLTGSSQCSSTASGATASLACAGDLGDLEVLYDGTTHPDSSDHAIANFAITAEAQPNPSPSPANIVLASNVVDYPINAGNMYVENGFLRTLSTGALLYVYTNDENAWIGTFTPSSTAVSQPVELNGVYDPESIAVAPNGSLWLSDGYNLTIDCWNSVGGAMSGAAPDDSFPWPDLASGNQMQVGAIAVDGQNDVWLTGYDSELGPSYALENPAASGCISGFSTPQQISLSADSEFDTSPFLTPLASGVALQSYSAGMFVISTSGSVTQVTPAAGLSYSDIGGLGADPAGNVYAAYTNYETDTADAEWIASGAATSTSLLTLVPTSSVSEANAYPYGLTVFSPTGSTADRLLYADDAFNAFGFVDNLHATPGTILDALTNAYSLYQPTYGSTGAAYMLYLAYDPISDVNSLNIARAVNTTTWSAPVISSEGGECTSGGLMSINERGDSGPFTVVASPAANVTVAPFPGSDHDYLIEPYDANSVTVQLTITDANGRQMVIPSFTSYEGEDC